MFSGSTSREVCAEDGGLFRSTSDAISGACSRLKRLQILNQVGLLLRGKVEGHRHVVAVDHVVESGRAAIVEVGRMLPDSLERAGAPHFGGRPERIGRIREY